MTGIKFTKVASNEFVFDFKKQRYLLVEKKQGVFGIGKAILLYQLDGVKRNFVKTIGWIQSDNHGCNNFRCVLGNGIVTWDDCKEGAVNYLKAILK